MAGAARAVDAPAVSEGRRQAGDEDVPVVAGAVAARMQGDLRERLVAVERIDDEEDGRAVAAQQGEIDAVGLGRGAEGHTTTASDPQSEHKRGRRRRGTENAMG